ncbi:YfbU family protein [Flavobacterium amniphilum]|uniref:YfbU family protein n=1 Tax=Flavobacterium amniphilum TaxID=1834035 RepID=UPI002029E7AD|nr:YfbU family protein [Flavobacterium amniphilum]MCL9805761.1 YfbU family protein [Flavobacterium amniphilum]MCL9806348.1 YfbU family protein [Flavobacterium amniphilum]
MIPETLSIVERQILANQYRILSKIEDTPEDYELKIEILENGFTERYYEVFDVAPEEISLEVCEETTQILFMYKRINDALKKMSLEDKKGLDLDKIKFEGFNARKDQHYHYLEFMIEKMDLWQEHLAVYSVSADEFQLPKYKRMLEYQIYLLDNDKYEFSKKDIEQMINVVANPSNKIPFQLAV